MYVVTVRKTRRNVANAFLSYPVTVVDVPNAYKYLIELGCVFAFCLHQRCKLSDIALEERTTSPRSQQKKKTKNAQDILRRR